MHTAPETVTFGVSQTCSLLMPTSASNLSGAFFYLLQKSV
jgi:hypothetical protein